MKYSFDSEIKIIESIFNAKWQSFKMQAEKTGNNNFSAILEIEEDGKIIIKSVHRSPVNQ